MVAEDVARGREGSGVCARLATEGAEGGRRRELHASGVGLQGRERGGRGQEGGATCTGEREGGGVKRVGLGYRGEGSIDGVTGTDREREGKCMDWIQKDGQNQIWGGAGVWLLLPSLPEGAGGQEVMSSSSQLHSSLLNTTTQGNAARTRQEGGGWRSHAPGCSH